MNERGRAPQRRKLPFTKRAVIALIKLLEDHERKIEERKRRKAAQRRAAAKRKRTLKQRMAVALLHIIERFEGSDKKTSASKGAPTRANAQKRPPSRQGAQQRPSQHRQPRQGAAQRPAQSGKGAPAQRRPMTAEERRRRAAYLKRMHKRKRIVQIGAAVAILLIVLVILSTTVLFKIQNIEITNPEDANYTESQIVSESGIVYGTQNLFTCDLDKVAKNIEQRLPYIGKAEVSRSFPKTLRVTVTPTKASAAIAYGTGYLLIDEQGKMLEKTETAPDGIPVLRCKTEFELNLGQYIGVSPNGRKADDKTKAAAEMITLYKKINAALAEAQIEDITLIDIRDVRAITLMYQNRLTLHLGTQDNLEQKLKAGAKTIAAESDASRTRTGAIDLTSIPYIFSRDTYDTQDEEATTEPAEPESVTEVAA